LPPLRLEHFARDEFELKDNRVAVAALKAVRRRRFLSWLKHI